jgi:glutamate/aspartate transport system permease protein
MLHLDFSFLDWEFLRNWISKGFLFSVQLTLTAMIGGIILGTVLALMRLSSKSWLEKPAAIYVDTLRSVPLVMVILWFYLLVPGFLRPYGIELGSERSALITFTLFEATYYSEIMRAGIQSVSRGQVFAGYAMGMSYRQTMQLVVLPQAFRNMLPVLLTQTIVLFQDTPARTSTVQSRPTCSPPLFTSSSASACRCSYAGCRRRSPSSVEVTL